MKANNGRRKTTLGDLLAMGFVSISPLFDNKTKESEMSDNKEVFVVFHDDCGLKETNILGGFEDEKKAWDLCESNVYSLFKVKNYSIDEYEIVLSKDKNRVVIKERTSIKVLHKFEYRKVIVY